jgi:hypothetical protein
LEWSKTETRLLRSCSKSFSTPPPHPLPCCAFVQKFTPFSFLLYDVLFHRLQIRMYVKNRSELGQVHT